MKTKLEQIFRNSLLSIVPLLFAFCSGWQSRAADLTWDANAATAPNPSDGAGSWNTSTANWWSGLANVSWDNATLNRALFGAGVGAAGTVSLPSNTTNTVGGITFNAPLSGNYTISGDSSSSKLNFVATPIITVASGLSSTMTVVCAGSSFAKAGLGTLTLNPGAPYVNSGPTFVGGGVLVIGTSSSGRLIIPGDLTVTNSGTARLGASDVISDSSTVTVANFGVLDMNIKSETIAGLVLNGANIVQTGTETLKVTGSFDARAGAVNSINGKLDVGAMTKSTINTVTLESRGSSAAGGGITNLVLNDGTLFMDYTQNNSKLLDTGSLTINGGTMMLVNGSHAEKVGSMILNGGVITNYSGTASLTLSGGNYDVRSGSVFTGLNGTAGLTKTTAGTVILGAQTGYTGDTRITDGTLAIQHIAALFSTTLDLSAADTGNLDLGTLPYFYAGGLKGSRNLTLANATNGPCSLLVGGNNQNTTYDGGLSGTAGMTKFGTGQLTLTGTNTYTGGTQVNGGALLVNGLLGVTGSSDVSVSAGSFGGNGIIKPRIHVLSGGTLSPGTSIGKLTITTPFSFAVMLILDPGSTCLMELDRAAGTNDFVDIIGAVLFDGTLSVTNLSATPLAAGDSFKLFNATQGYLGAFAAIDPTTPGPNLAWDTSGLTNNGTLSVVAAAAQPTLQFSRSGNTLTLSWTDPGFKLQAQTNPISSGLGSNWGDFPNATNSPVNVPIVPAHPTVFFRLINQ